ncbi:MAG: hexameric tyrosine-coordinated heme protein [Chloroflexota bacterium]
MSEKWLPSLITEDTQTGFELAIKLARMGVKYTQPSADVRDKLRPKYGEDATDLIASSQVIATNFQTVAAANNYWRE